MSRHTLNNNLPSKPTRNKTMQQNEITAVLSPNADNELDINQRQYAASGYAYVIVSGVLAHVNFAAELDIKYEAGERWGGYTAIAPTAEIENVYGLKLGYDDVTDLDFEPVNYTLTDADKAAIAQCIENFIYSGNSQLETPNKYQRYADPTL